MVDNGGQGLLPDMRPPLESPRPQRLPLPPGNETAQTLRPPQGWGQTGDHFIDGCVAPGQDSPLGTQDWVDQSGGGTRQSSP